MNLSPKTPEAFFAEAWEKVPSYIRLTFASAVILGMVTHLYAFANKLTNHDDINHLFFADYGTASGRWFLPAVLSWDGPFSMPWLIGVLSVLCLAGAACFTVSLLRIRRPLGCVITAAVLVSFPTVTATFAYMFTADAYLFGLLLAAFAAYAAVRWGWKGSVLGAAALTLSLGVYQSYFGVAAVLMVGALLFDTLDGERSFQELFLRGLRLFGTLVASLVVYMVIVKITTRDIGLVDYMGISQMGNISLKDMPRLLFLSYGKYFSYFLYNDSGHHFAFLRYAFVLTGLCAVALGVLVVKKRRLDPARTALAAALALAYPLAGDVIYIMVSGEGVHMLMLYGLSFILILPVAMAEYAELDLPSITAQAVRAAASWVILLSIALTAFSYMITANSAYLKIDLSMRQLTAYSTRLLDKIESCDGYYQGMPVFLVGTTTAEEALAPTPELNSVRMTGVFDLAAFRTTYDYNSFLRYYLGFSGPVYTDLHAETQALAQREEIQAMPSYPQTGSIRVIDGAVVVKLN